MATTPANLMQTAVNAAATQVAAFAQAGLITSLDEAKAEFGTIRDSIFEGLSAQPGESAPSVRSTSSGTTAPRGQGGGKQFTAEEARAIDLIFGKFKGVTLGELENMDAETCAEYGYEGKNGEARTGLAYLKYLANNEDPKGSFTRKAATAILEDRRAAA